MWKLVASNQSISLGSKKGSSKEVAGPLPPYYVWGVIKHFDHAKEVVIDLRPSFLLQDDSATGLWNLSAWGNEDFTSCYFLSK